MFPVFTYRVGKFLTYLSTFFYRKKPIRWTIKKYWKKYKIGLNLNDPSSFYEKMNYWKHFCYSDKQDNLTDKLIVKDVLIKDGFGKCVAKCFFKTDNVSELKKWVEENKGKISKFVIKASHSCGDVFIYENGAIIRKGGRRIKSLNKLYKMLKTSLKYNHYYSRFELNYKNLKPMIYVEEYIDFDDSSVEYEIMLNYGEIIFCNVVSNRQGPGHIEYLEDNKFKPFDSANTAYKPKEFQLICEIIKKECSSFPFCRVDFVENKSKTYFMEFTFCKSGGIGILSPSELNSKLGKLFKL